LILIVFFLLLAGITAALGAMSAGQSQRILNELAEAVLVYKLWISQPFEVFGFHIYPQLLLENLEQVAGSVLSVLPERSLNLLSGMRSNLVWGFVMLVSLYYFLIDGPKIKMQIFSYVPTEYQYDMQRLTAELDEIWGVFIRIQLLIFVVLAALMSSGTFLVIWLFRSGLLGFSPLGFVLLLVLVYAAAQQVDNLWLRPKLMGKHLRLHPGLVFAGLMAGLFVGGILGALLIVPLIASLRVIGNYIHRQLLDLPPWPEDDPVFESDAGEITPINGSQLED
jgi:predicted PurR-regulated permease PerM